MRDALWGLPSQDFDVEVYGMNVDEIEATLAPFGTVLRVGKSFGVLKLSTGSAYQYDFALPRKERKTAAGHCGFDVQCDPHLPPQIAASRRDFTINSILYDPIADQLLDYYGGIRDLEDRRLRHVSPAFVEDPLRVLRGMQFVSRFDLTPAPETVDLCRKICKTYHELATERIYGEWMKWATLSKVPSRGILFLEATRWWEHTPILSKLRKTPQDPIWHPEGDVLTHTLMACDALVQQDGWDKLDAKTRAVLLFAMLCHDFGKPQTLSFENRDGILRIHAYGHPNAGAPIAEKFLTKIGVPESMKKRIVALVREHLVGSMCGPNGFTKRALHRLSLRLVPENIRNLIRIVRADGAGCAGDRHIGKDSISEQLWAKAVEEHLEDGPIKAVLNGDTIMHETGLTTGPEVGLLVKQAYSAQQQGSFKTLEEGIAWLHLHLEKKTAKQERLKNNSTENTSHEDN